MEYTFIIVRSNYNMSKPEMTPKQKTLTNARHATRIGFALMILGGVVLLLWGIFTSYLPTLVDGMVGLASSVPLYAMSKLIEKKLTATLS